MIRNSWIRAKGKLYYATKNGSLVVGCRRQIDGAWYAFGRTGEQLKGKRTFGGRTYYFGLKTGKDARESVGKRKQEVLLLRREWCTRKELLGRVLLCRKDRRPSEKHVEG